MTPDKQAMPVVASDATVLLLHAGSNALPTALDAAAAALAKRSSQTTHTVQHFDVGTCTVYVPPVVDHDSPSPGLRIWAIMSRDEAVDTVLLRALKAPTVPSDDLNTSTDTDADGTRGGESAAHVVICPVLDISNPESLAWQVSRLLSLLETVENFVPVGLRGPLVLVGADKLLPNTGIEGLAGGRDVYDTCLESQTRQHIAGMLCYCRLFALHLGGLPVLGLPAGDGARFDRPCGQRLVAALRAATQGEPYPIMSPVLSYDCREGFYCPEVPNSFDAVIGALRDLRATFTGQALGQAGWAGHGLPIELDGHGPECPMVAKALTDAGCEDGDVLLSLGEHPWLPSSFPPQQDMQQARWEATVAPLTGGQSKAKRRTSGVGAAGSGRAVPSMGEWAEGLLANIRAQAQAQAQAQAEGGAARRPAQASTLLNESRVSVGGRSSVGVLSAGVGPGSGRAGLGGRSRASSTASAGSTGSTGAAMPGSAVKAPMATTAPPSAAKPPVVPEAASSARSAGPSAASAAVSGVGPAGDSAKPAEAGAGKEKKDASKFFLSKMSKPPTNKAAAKPTEG